MENSIAKMRQMSLHSYYIVRENPLPAYESKAPPLVPPELQNQGKSLKPNFNIEVEYPDS